MRWVLRGPEGRDKLLKARAERGKPFKDGKVLADWNFLSVAALSHAAFRTGRREYSKLAEDVFTRVYKRLYRGNLMHTDGVSATLDDYAYAVYALINLHSVTGKPDYLVEAFSLADEALAGSWDRENGTLLSDHLSGFSEIYDGALPSGVSVMFYNLEILHSLSGRYADEVANLREVFAGFLEDSPSGVFSDPSLEGLPDLSGKRARGGRTTVYVCKGGTCFPPVNTPEELERVMGEISEHRL